MNALRAIYDAAHRFQESGYSLVALEPGGKRPILPGWQTIRSTHRLIDEWFSACASINIGLHAGFSRIAVADCDSEQAAEWVASNLPASPLWQESARGGLHVLYHDPDGRVPPRVNLMNIQLDLRGQCSQIVASPSVSHATGRRWLLRGELVRPEALPVMPIDWLADAERARLRAVLESPRQPPSGRRASWARRVLFEEYWSVEGAGGDMALFRAACFLVQRAGLTDGQALALLREWNVSNARPPWADHRLSYKISEARRLMR